jgi:6-phospho-beta-glucosidase
MRLVILGGSGAATPEIADGLADWPGGVDRRPPLELVLVSRSASKLELVVAETRRRVAGLPGAPVTVSGATDRREAIRGAEVIVNAVRIGGLDARVFDETFPQALGLPGEETMGPGGFANAVRTIPALAATWRDVAEVAPDALTINLTNPSGIVVLAAERQAGLRLVSMCDSPVTLAERIAARLGVPVGDVRARTYGLNHVGWWVPGSADELDACADLATDQDPGAVWALGVVGGPYVRYYLHPDRVLAQQRAAGTVRAQQLQALERTMLTGYAAGATELPKRGAAWYGKAVLPLVDAWRNGSDTPLTVGLRNDGRVPGLPDGVMTEGPVSFPEPGVMVPVPVPPSPPLAAALLAQHAAFEAMTAEAVVAGGARDDLVRALLGNPMVSSYDLAAGLVDTILSGSPR